MLQESCCPDRYSGDKDAFLGNHSFEHSLWDGLTRAVPLTLMKQRTAWCQRSRFRNTTFLHFSNVKSCEECQRQGQISYLHEIGHQILVLPFHLVWRHTAGRQCVGLLIGLVLPLPLLGAFSNVFCIEWISATLHKRDLTSPASIQMVSCPEAEQYSDLPPFGIEILARRLVLSLLLSPGYYCTIL